MKEKWKLALEKFLEGYEEDDDVIGAILTGSYATGNNNKNSDIDVYILLKDNVSYQERGNCLVNGFLIEYFMNPSWKVKEYFEKQHDNNMSILANMFCYGKVIFDTEGKIEELQKLATEYIDKPLKSITDDKLKSNNYHIWDSHDELKNLQEEKNKSFNPVYYYLVSYVLNAYYEYLGIPELPLTKAYKILTDDKYREKYHIFNIPEKEFIKLYVNCFKETTEEEMYDNVTKMIDYYYNKIGGFDIKKYIQKRELY